MRLTLRTLLAYHHGVLGPADQEDLHRRIQQSQDAGKLLRRINTLTQQSQVMSPPLEGKGLGADPNSVAEYLDDALKGPDVPELERVCLESDAQLAELAHCHELLATAMHTQVTVPKSLRATAICLADPAQRKVIEKNLLTRRKGKSTTAGATTEMANRGAAEATEDAVQVQSPMVVSGGESIRPEGLSLEDTRLAHEVPEYLVGSARGRWRIPLAIGSVTALLILLVWQTLGPWSRIRELFVAAPTLESDEPPLTVRIEKGIQAEPDNSVFHELVISDEVPPSPEVTKPLTEPDEADGLPDSAVTVTDQPPPIPGASVPAGEIVEESNSAPPGVPSPTPAQPEEGVDEAPPAPPGTDDGQATWKPAEAESRQVLLIRQDKDLSRLVPGAKIVSGSHLIVPPATHAELDLPGGISWSTRGPSRLTIDSTAEPCQIETPLCRALVRSPAERPLLLATPLGRFEIVPADNSSLVSIEVSYRRKTHGSVLDRRAYAPVLVIIAAEGSVQVINRTDGSDQDVDDIALGQGLAVIEGQRPAKFRLATIPDWFRAAHGRPADWAAVHDLADWLPAEDGKLVEALSTLAAHRRPETSALAIQTAIMLGDWNPMVNELLDADRLRSHWTPTLDLARQVLASDPSQAEALKELLVANYGDANGDRLFQLVRGIDQDQLLADGLSSLVSELDSDSLPLRVLAAYQLEELTGKRLAYQPHAANRASIQQWRREVAPKRQNLLPDTDPIWERNSK